MHIDLASLTLTLPTCIFDLEEILDGLVGNVTHLQQLHIYIENEVPLNTQITILPILLKGLTKLQHISLPFLTPELFKSFGRLESLISIRRTRVENKYFPDRLVRDKPLPIMKSVTHLEMTISLGDISKVVTRAPCLQHLSVCLRWTERVPALELQHCGSIMSESPPPGGGRHTAQVELRVRRSRDDR